jgi:hypothetical protein
VKIGKSNRELIYGNWGIEPGGWELMAKTWTDYQKRISESILKHRADTKAGYDFKTVKEELGEVSQGKISEVAKALRENKWIIPSIEAVNTPQAKEGGKLVTVTGKQPAPVVFFLGKEEIELEPSALYESFLLYQDMKVRCDLKDGFSSVIRDGVGLLWRVLVSEPKVEQGKIKVEVTNGRGTGQGEEEPGT